MLAKDLVAQRLKYCEEIDAAACFDRVFYDARGKQFPHDRAAGFSDAIYGARHTPNSGRKVIPLAHAVRSQTSQQPTTHDCLTSPMNLRQTEQPCRPTTGSRSRYMRTCFTRRSYLTSCDCSRRPASRQTCSFRVRTTQGLTDILKSGLTWSDYPLGTILHAIERLLPTFASRPDTLEDDLC